jgi:hypothetical protein
MPSDPEALRRTLQAQLRDIQLPEAVSWWPPAWGWWLLVIAVFVVVALVAWHYRKLRHGLRVRRAAVAAAATHYQEWRRTGNDRAYIDRANALVRQVAIATDGRNRVARYVILIVCHRDRSVGKCGVVWARNAIGRCHRR